MHKRSVQTDNINRLAGFAVDISVKKLLLLFVLTYVVSELIPSIETITSKRNLSTVAKFTGGRKNLI